VEEGVPLMDVVVAAVVAALLSGFSGYLWGNRRLRYERLYVQRAEVLCRLGELLYGVQRGFVTFTSFYQSGDPDRKEQLEEANRGGDLLRQLNFRDGDDEVVGQLATAFGEQ